MPLRAVSTLNLQPRTEKIQRRNQFRTVTVSAFPEAGVLASEVMNEIRADLTAFEKSLPPGYRMEIGGEEEEQKSGFVDLAIVLAISVTMIFLALVFQFKHAIKPFIVFAAIPYGVVGALAGLWVMNAPFGFMAFLGIASLVGVIVSHIIVLFDFIEEKREEGEPLDQALLDAGIMRLRPVLITVGATVIALFPLAAHGGPLWEQMCYTQIGGLTAATFITLLLLGQVTLVGPRPEIPEMTPYYSESERAKFAVKPGITGAAQISGRALLTWKETVALDVDYVENRSLRRDVEIVVGTVKAAITGRGAF